MSSFSLRRFSTGDRPWEFPVTVVWKFDVLVPQITQQPLTCYVGHAVRGNAFTAFFSRYPGSRIFGTGLPLTAREAKAEIGVLQAGEIVLVNDHDAGEIIRDG